MEVNPVILGIVTFEACVTLSVRAVPLKIETLKLKNMNERELGLHQNIKFDSRSKSRFIEELHVFNLIPSGTLAGTFIYFNLVSFLTILKR